MLWQITKCGKRLRLFVLKSSFIFYHNNLIFRFKLKARMPNGFRLPKNLFSRPWGRNFWCRHQSMPGAWRPFAGCHQKCCHDFLGKQVWAVLDGPQNRQVIIFTPLLHFSHCTKIGFPPQSTVDSISALHPPAPGSIFGIHKNSPINVADILGI